MDWAVISSLRGRIWDGRWGDLSVFAALKEPSLLITGGAWLRAPPLRACAVARSLCSVWEIVTEIQPVQLQHRVTKSRTSGTQILTPLRTWKKKYYSEGWWLTGLTEWTGMFIWGSSIIWYIVHVAPKCSHLMKVSHILQLSRNRTAEHCLLTAKSSLTNLVMHQFEKAP